MTERFSSNTSSFGPGVSEDYLREIVHGEFLLLFDDIRVEIEDKIKSIDKNIGLLREEVSQLALQTKSNQSQPSQQHNHEIKDKLDKIEAEMQLLRYQQQLELRTSRARSYDKERKPIFKKDREHEDFGSLVLGLDSAEKKSSHEDKKGKQYQKILERKELNKPPLPDGVGHQKATLCLDSARTAGGQFKRDEVAVRHNPVLDKSDSVHRWLHENNNSSSRFSCFNSVIREEDIEESLYY